ncbi:hypothetical protein CPB83DRAFT_457740 [Crepidotus variabilis]|uniref:F-box domain-containing protein n=1 Tax=Crepidotus variabilis TaxID=179855 RepID=A0A9P6ECD5_9AGAR|nr:hypothetical protein CPB83DRAFT_457740 [Crepidotus variabilis]
MIDLPQELWVHIVGYLPQQDFKGLYSVNSAFFHISMDARYRNITVKFQELNISTLQLLEWLQIQPSLARRVRKLTLAPSRDIGLSESWGDGIQPARWANHRILNFRPYVKPVLKAEEDRLFEPLVLGHVTVAQLDNALCRMIPLMIILQEVDLKCADGEVPSLTCYGLLWKRYEDTIAELHLLTNFLPSSKPSIKCNSMPW